MPHRFAYTPILWRHLLSLGCLFSNDPNLCQADSGEGKDRYRLPILLFDRILEILERVVKTREGKKRHTSKEGKRIYPSLQTI